MEQKVIVLFDMKQKSIISFIVTRKTTLTRNLVNTTAASHLDGIVESENAIRDKNI